MRRWHETFHVDFGRLGWAYGPIQRCWEWGHDPVAMLRIFGEDLPTYLQNILRVGMAAMQIVESYKTGTKKVGDSLLLGEASGMTGPAEVPDCHDQLWELNEEVSFMKLRWRNEQRERASVHINNSVCRVFGIHKEELLARLARHEIPLLTSEFEWLCRILDLAFFSLSSHAGRPMVRYERFLLKFGREVRGALGCITNMWEHSWSGDVEAACFCVRPVSLCLSHPSPHPLVPLAPLPSRPWQALSTSDLVRPVTSLCRHDGSGQELLDTCCEDVEVREGGEGTASG
eukprot:753165-Hanusia_phi.AAC.2